MNRAVVAKEKELLADFEKLSQERQQEVVDFVAYLKVREELEATKEILNDRNFVKSIMKGDEDFQAGRFKRWSEIKKNNALKYFGIWKDMTPEESRVLEEIQARREKSLRIRNL